MAQAYKCDLCGKFYEGVIPIAICLVRRPSCPTENANRYDICSDCEKSFEWWKESRNPDRKSVFEDKEDQ